MKFTLIKLQLARYQNEISFLKDKLRAKTSHVTKVKTLRVTKAKTLHVTKDTTISCPFGCGWSYHPSKYHEKRPLKEHLANPRNGCTPAEDKLLTSGGLEKLIKCGFKKLKTDPKADWVDDFLKYRCNGCEYKTYKRQRLNKHATTCCFAAPVPPPVITEKRLECKGCKYKTYKGPLLNRHTMSCPFVTYEGERIPPFRAITGKRLENRIKSGKKRHQDLILAGKRWSTI